MKVPVIGPPPRWAWFPQAPQWKRYTPARGLTRLAHDLWARHFDGGSSPPVYLSPRLGARSDVEARTYHWGIVVSERWWRHERRCQHWARGVLLHELLHWAGWKHGWRFRSAAKKLGTR